MKITNNPRKTGKLAEEDGFAILLIVGQIDNQ